MNLSLSVEEKFSKFFCYFCFRYIVSFLLDSTIGLLIVWLGIRICILIAKKKFMPTPLFGEYGKLS